jgi:hypothetical protein
MSMIQLVIGTALGFLVAQALLYGFSRGLGWLRGGDFLARARAVRATPAPTVLSALIRYAAPAGVSVALVTLGIWATNDYLAAKSARNAAAHLFDSSAPVPGPEQDSPPVRSVALTPAPAPEVIEEPAAPDPYADPEFRVQRKPHRARAASLKETLVQQSEARARGELLRELQQHVRRSQYDCEAAPRADRYLRAGLDVWGFAAWQVKYFPQTAYRGATLDQCRDIKSVVASPVDLQSATAQQSEAVSEH